MSWNKLIPENEIKEKVTDVTVEFAKEFGEHLGKCDKQVKLTTSQLRKFFGEVKKQQMNGYDETEFILLKPKLAYAVGRARSKVKSVKLKDELRINDFYHVISKAIDCVKADTHEESEKRFHNFIKVFEAIVAYHKAAEESKMNDNN